MNLLGRCCKAIRSEWRAIHRPDMGGRWCTVDGEPIRPKANPKVGQHRRRRPRFKLLSESERRAVERYFRHVAGPGARVAWNDRPPMSQPLAMA